MRGGFETGMGMEGTWVSVLRVCVLGGLARTRAGLLRVCESLLPPFTHPPTLLCLPCVLQAPQGDITKTWALEDVPNGSWKECECRVWGERGGGEGGVARQPRLPACRLPCAACAHSGTVPAPPTPLPLRAPHPPRRSDAAQGAADHAGAVDPLPPLMGCSGSPSASDGVQWIPFHL